MTLSSSLRALSFFALSALALAGCKQGENEPCDVEQDCGDGLFCCNADLPARRGVCLPDDGPADACRPIVTPTPDAGPEPEEDGAVSEDAAVREDAAVGEDAAMTEDAGPRDAGSPDSGPPDAGPSDAGPTDAGSGDAGPTDAA